jgi:hypothetical protein
VTADSAATASAGAPVDVPAIRKTVAAILQPRDTTPETAEREQWYSQVRSHLHLLLPLAAENAAHADDGTRTLVASIDTWIRHGLADGLPPEPDLAEVELRALARECLGLLGLALDVPGTGS